MLQLSDHDLTLLYNRLHVVRASVEHDLKDTAIQALNLIELQIVRALSAPKVITLIPAPEPAEA